MLLGEPPRTQGDINFNLLRIPVRIHPGFWVLALVLGMNGSSVPAILTWIVAVFLSILVHELGHALVIRSYGYHAWITLCWTGGLASHNPGESHGLRGPTALDQVLISLAGPMAGFLLAAVIVVPMAATGYVAEFFPYGAGWPWIKPYLIGSERFTYFLLDMLYINIFWGLVNLLPIYPLDGGQIAREIFLVFNPREGIRRSLIVSIVTSVALVALALNSGRWFPAVFFGYLGYSGYQTLQAYTHGRRW